MFGAAGCFLFLFFLLLEFVNNLIDDFQLFFLGLLAQAQQGILERNVMSIDRELIKHIRAALELLIIRISFRQHRDGAAQGRLGKVIFSLLIVELAESGVINGLFNSVTL